MALVTVGSPVNASPLAYATTGSDLFGVVDLNTGVFTETGDMGLRLTGLGVATGGVLYGGGYHQGTLYSINPLTGALTAIGTASSFTYFATGSTTSGLFALDSNADMNLYSVDPTTGAVTVIGPTGVSPIALVEGLSTGSGTLYLTRNSSLYTIDTSSGAATLVGTSSAGLFGPTVFEDGALYSGAAYPSAIWTIDTTDGSGTFIADETGAADPNGNFWGLAPQSVPEPPSWLSMIAALVGFGLISHFRKTVS